MMEYRLNIKWPLEKDYENSYNMLKKHDGKEIKLSSQIPYDHGRYRVVYGKTFEVMCPCEWVEEIKEESEKEPQEPEKEFKEFFKSTGWLPETKIYAYEVWRKSRAKTDAEYLEHIIKLEAVIISQYGSTETDENRIKELRAIIDRLMDIHKR